MGVETKHRAVVRSETIVSTAIYALVPSVVLWCVGAPPPQAMFGQQGITTPLLLAAGVGTFMMTLVLTSIVRLRVRKGSLPSLHWPRVERGAMRYLPSFLLARAFVLAVISVAIFVPMGIAAVGLASIVPLTSTGFFVLNSIYGAAIGAVMTRFVVLAAMADDA